MERALIIAVIVVAVAVVGVLAYGLIFENVIKARQAVAVVGDAPIRAADFQARARFTRMQMRLELKRWQDERMSVDPSDENSKAYLDFIDQNVRKIEDQLSEANAQTIGDQVLDQLILYELVRQEAERRGVVVTEQEVQRKIELDLNYDRTAATLPLTSTGELTPTAPLSTPMTEEDFQRQYKDIIDKFLKPLDISERQYRSWVKADLLVQKLREEMAGEVPREAEQVKLLADELKADEQASASVTELDWFPKSILEAGLGTELANLAFDLDVGEYSRPMPVPGGTYYVVIQVLGREVRELDETVRQQMAEDAFQKWVEAEQFRVERRSYRDLVPTTP